MILAAGLTSQLSSFSNMSGSKPLVLVLGATGQTGRSIVNGLLKSGEFVSVKVRFTSSARY